MNNLPAEIQSDQPVERIPTLEEARSRQIEAKQETSQGLFAESDNIAKACVEENKEEWDMTDAQIIEDIGNISGDSRTTLYDRLRVGRVFPESWRKENEWATEAKFWSHFNACALTWTKESPDIPYKWMEYCVNENMGVRALKAAIRLANGRDPDEGRPVYAATNAWATVSDASDDELGLAFDEKLKAKLEPGDRVVVTIVKESEMETAKP